MKQVFHTVVSTWVLLTGFDYETHTDSEEDMEKKIAVGLLKMADGNEDVDFGVVLEGEKK